MATDVSATYPPPTDFSAQAHVQSMEQYRELYQQSIDNPEAYWAEVAADSHFFEKWSRVLEWNPPFAKWFVGAKTNMSYNCLDLQIERGRGDHPAIIWEGEPAEADGTPKDQRTLTYSQLRDEVCRFANALKAQGIKKGDRITLYMPMVPELAIAILACARIGAPHSVIFGGFSAQAIADRLQDADSHVVITSDGGWRRGGIVPLKANVDEACGIVGNVKKVIVLKRCENDIAWNDERDVWWHDIVADTSTDCPAEQLDAEHMLFLLYTSGSTGKPKGILHTTAGYMVYTRHTTKNVFDLHDDDVYWCTADIGWITGHSYIVYGPLQNGVTNVMYEGAPNFPDWARFWQICQRYKVSKFYTAPTAIRAFMKQGEDIVKQSDLSSLKLLGTVGEPINPAAWTWYHKHIGGERCPIVDTWWQTETGGIMISPMPGAVATKPGSATLPQFGIDCAVVDAQGKEVEANETGLLIIRKPWPGMLRGVYGDEARYRKQYWSTVENAYFTGDGVRRDEDGYFWIIGRVDDVIKVSGHRLGTAEIESALVSHEAVAEAAVIGYPDELTGEAIAAFVTLKGDADPGADLENALRKHVAATLGAIAKPKMVRFTEGLPKTRSGKIMRRLLRELATTGRIEGDITTLEDLTTVAKLSDAKP